MRLFVAVNLSSAMREEIAQCVRPLDAAFPDVRWTPAEALHVTLRFLGTVADEQVDGLRAVLDACAVAHAPFRLRVGGLGAFPRLARPQVLWLAVDDGGVLQAVARDLERGLEPLGHAPEPRAFTPHVTIGRARSRRGSRPAPGPLPACEIGAAMHVETIDLMQSHLGQGPARYEIVHVAPLGRGVE